MTREGDWRAIIASSLNWEQAHASLETAVRAFPSDLRGRRPAGFPHSGWELLEHIRITQRDLLDFLQNPEYEEKLEWPKDYWPASMAPSGDKEWNGSVSGWKKDRIAIERFITAGKIDLTAKIPKGTGQTYLRTILVTLDHNAYHVGQIVAVRQLLGAWPPPPEK